MQRYDITSKVLFKDYARDFVGLTIKDQEFEIIEKIDTELPIVQMRMTDAPVRVRIGDEEAIVHYDGGGLGRGLMITILLQYLVCITNTITSPPPNPLPIFMSFKPRRVEFQWSYVLQNMLGV